MRRLLLATVRTVVAILFAFPLYWLFVTATGAKGNAYRIPPVLFPRFDFSSMAYVLGHSHLLRYMLNSIGITGATIALVLATSILAGYGLAAFKLRGAGALFPLLLGSLILPEQALLIPQYLVNYHLHLLDTYTVMIIPLSVSSSSIFLFRQFFLSMPVEWSEVARLEGLGTLRYLWRVALPLSKPVVMTVVLLSFITSWNQFQWPLIMTSSRHIDPIEVALGHYLQAYVSSWRKLASTAILALAPIVVVFAIAQRHIVSAVVGVDTGVEE